MLNPLRVDALLSELDRAHRTAIEKVLRKYQVQSYQDLRRILVEADETSDVVTGVWLLARLGRRGDVVTLHQLLALTRHYSPEVRAEAARAFSIRPNEKAIKPLSHLLLKDPSQEVRVASAYALGHMKYPASLDALVTSLGKLNEEPEVRGMAAESLGLLKIRDPRAVDALIKSLRDKSPEVVFWSAGALGAIRERRALPDLNLLLGRSEIVVGFGSVSDEAKEAIQMIASDEES